MKKFRVWDGEKMVYPETIILGINPWNGLFSASFELDNGGHCISSYVMQYIGVKDKNDKEIYEKDVCRVSLKYFDIKDELAKVIFKNGCFCFQFGCTDDYVKIFEAWDVGSVEIVGNTYENPNLFNSGLSY